MSVFWHVFHHDMILWLVHFKWIQCCTILFMYLWENASDEFQITKVCLCEIIKNQLHEGIHPVTFKSHDADFKNLVYKANKIHRNQRYTLIRLWYIYIYMLYSDIHISKTWVCVYIFICTHLGFLVVLFFQKSFKCYQPKITYINIFVCIYVCMCLCICAYTCTYSGRHMMTISF